jgi:hypothetical protein
MPLSKGPVLLLVLSQAFAGFVRRGGVRDVERLRAAIQDGVARLVGDCDLHGDDELDAPPAYGEGANEPPT